MLHHVYLTPGMFGFARLASFDYFAHVAHGLERRFKAAGHQVNLQVVDVSPTASIRRRAAKLAEVVGKTAGTEGPIHLLGHSTGGLDARFVASPGSQFANAGQAVRWFPRPGCSWARCQPACCRAPPYRRTGEQVAERQ